MEWILECCFQSHNSPCLRPSSCPQSLCAGLQRLQTMLFLKLMQADAYTFEVLRQRPHGVALDGQDLQHRTG